MKFINNKILETYLIELKKYLFLNKHNLFKIKHITKKLLLSTENIPDKVLTTFISSLEDIKEELSTDITAFIEHDPAIKDKLDIIYAYQTFNAILIYRIAHQFTKLEVKILPRILTEYAHSISGVDINPYAQIGKYFFIDHGTGVVIGETTIIKDHVSIYQGVTLGAKDFTLVKRHPTIMDNVTLYANVSIFGGNTVIGKNSVIGANVVVTKSVEENTILTINRKEK